MTPKQRAEIDDPVTQALIGARSYFGRGTVSVDKRAIHHEGGYRHNKTRLKKRIARL